MIVKPLLARDGARLALLGCLALSLGACSTLQRINPIHRARPPAATASAGQRVSIIQFDRAITPNASLATAGFQLPAPRAVTAWALPGATAEQSIEHVDAAPQFAVAWRSGIGAGSGRHAQITAPIVAADGHIYVMDAEARVSAYDAASGRREWDTNLRPSGRDKTAFGGGLAVSGGKVFVTSGFRLVAALDAATGSVAWTTRTEAPVHGAPTVSNGRVFAVDVDNEVFAWDAATGTQSWSFQAIVEPARILRASSAAVSGDAVVVPFSSGELTALRASNGQQLWQQVLSRTNRTNALSEIRDIAGRPIISRGTVFASSHSGVFAAVDLRSGQPRWTLPIASVNAPWAAGDVVYVLAKSGEMYCINRDSGQVYWIHDLNEGRGKHRGVPGFGRRLVKPQWAGPLLANNRLVVVNSDGEAVALDARTGAEQRSINLGGPAYIGPIAYDGMIYVVTDEAKLVAIR